MNLARIFPRSPWLGSVAAFIALLGTLTHSASGYSAWVAQSSPTTANLLGLAYFAAAPSDGMGDSVPGTFVLVGASGTIVTGVGPVTSVGTSGPYVWTLGSSGTTASLNAVTLAVLGNLQWLVAVGDKGTILTSTDTVHWTPRTSGTTQRLNAVAFASATGNGGGPLLVAVGDAGTVCTSLDGVNWTVQESGVTTSLRGVAVAQPQTVSALPVGVLEKNSNLGFVICGQAGVLLATVNGTTFTAIPTGTTLDLLGLTNANGYYPANPSLLLTMPSIPASTLLVVGQSGLVGLLDYSSGTPAWSFSQLGSADYRAVSGTATSSGFSETLLVGAGGIVNRPTPLNHGPLVLQLSPANDLNAVLVSAPTAVAVGQGGIIWAQETTGALAAPRLQNLSGRAESSTVPLTVGFVVNGTGVKGTLVRGIGPALIPFGVNGTQADPQLALYSGSNLLVTNDDWSTSTAAATIAAVTAQIGAFPLISGSKDAAAFASVGSGIYSSQVTGQGSAGLALAEVYDTDPLSADLSLARFTNFSFQSQTTGAAGSMIAGFVVGGDSNSGLAVLIRAVGPSLAQFGVAGAAAHPVLTVYQNGAVLATNRGWWQGAGGASTFGPEIESDAKAVGAFALPEGSADAALELTLPAGAYTATVTTADGAAGTVLLEVYQIGCSF